MNDFYQTRRSARAELKNYRFPMSETDFYKILGVSKNATQDEIRKAHRKLSREYHPDRKPGDDAAAEKFKQVQEAHSVLSDSDKRAKYDRFGSAAFQGGQANRGGGGFNDFFGGAGGAQIDLSSLFGGGAGFGDMFGQGGGRQQRPTARKGQDTKVSIDIPFHVAAEGGNHPINMTSGGRQQSLEVKIPAGVQTGSVIRLSGQGQPGQMGGPAGDLLVTIRVASHPYFRREGNNLLVDIPITVAEAMLGGKVDVPTLSEGTVVMTLPPGTSSGAKLRLREKGVADQKTQKHGDLLAVMKIVVPKDIDDESRDLVEQLQSRLSENPRDGIW